MTYLLAIDGGSQSTKASVVDVAGRIHGSGRAPLRPYALGSAGEATHPGDDLWDSLVEAVGLALSDFDGDPDAIVAAGLCGIRFCRALLDTEGRLTEPVQSWMDARVAGPPELSPAVALVTSAGGYLATRLTGSPRDAAASYAGDQWPIDPESRRWSADPERLARCGIPADLLPELVEPGELLGELTPEAARDTGLPPGRPVFATGNDKAVEALGCGLREPGQVVLSLGTYVTAMTMADRIPEHDPRVWANPAAEPGRWLAESAGIRRGMWTVTWLRDLVGPGAPGEVDPGDPAAITGWLEEGARTVPPGCGGLLTLPDWLAPAGAPYRRGAILGLDARHGPAHLYRSLLEGLAMTMRANVEAMESALGVPSSTLIVSGGGSRSPLLHQIAADVFGRPVHAAGQSDAAGIGAAICAAVGVGLHGSFADAVAAMVRTGRLRSPAEESRRRYADLFPTYSSLGRHTDPLFREIAATQRP